MRRVLLALAFVLCGCPDFDGLEPPDEHADAGAESTRDAGDVTSPDAGEPGSTEVCDGIDNDLDGLVDEGPNGELFPCGAGCPPGLFAGGYVADFTTSASFNAAWYSGYVAPYVAGNALIFGPFPETQNWWEKYGWANTKTTFGDVLVCARWLAEPSSRLDEFSMFLRHDNDLLFSLAVDHEPGQVSLNTRLSAQNNQWIQHAAVPFATEAGRSQVIDALLYAKAHHFVAEVRNATTGQSALLSADSPQSAATGDVGFVAWELGSPVRVVRVVVGTPTAQTAKILETR